MVTSKGIYILFLRNEIEQRIQVGKLGEFQFQAGIYAYAGTAYGSGGLHARLKRHFRQEKKVRWHIDYLSEVMTPVIAWVSGSVRQGGTGSIRLPV